MFGIGKTWIHISDTYTCRDLSGRMVAVNGFLNLLTGQMNDNASPAAQGIAFESLGLLRRCFNQQAQVRVAAYQGLGALSKHSTLTGDIFEVLYGQVCWKIGEAYEGIYTHYDFSLVPKSLSKRYRCIVPFEIGNVCGECDQRWFTSSDRADPCPFGKHAQDLASN